MKYPAVNFDRGAGWLQRLRDWAAHNALTLVFMAVMFVLTWAVIILTTAWEVANGN